ncbi:unnamed protein product [Clonostachys rosea]|uniref:Transmembrane protein n=1 Tax=Bionectria ochroleuca TaxID=29856 RepID=A0ABY6TXV9_BIOOC|nr:unnamed protein product [Clonostachys rosea]
MALFSTTDKDFDPRTYPFTTLTIVDLVLLSSAAVISFAGVYFAFKDLPPHATAEIKVRPRTTAVLTSFLMILSTVPVAMILHQALDDPSLPDARKPAIKYTSAVISILDAAVSFLVLSFLIRLVDFVHRPVDNASSSSDSPSKTSDRLIKGLGVAVVLAIINNLVIAFGLPDDGIRDITAADVVVWVLSIIINVMYLVIIIIVLTTRGPLLAVAIVALLRYINALLSPFILLGASKLFDIPVFFKFITALSILGVILTQCAEAIIVLVLIKVLAHQLADSGISEEPQDPARRPLLASANEQPAGTFNASSE